MISLPVLSTTIGVRPERVTREGERVQAGRERGCRLGGREGAGWEGEREREVLLVDDGLWYELSSGVLRLSWVMARGRERREGERGGREREEREEGERGGRERQEREEGERGERGGREEERRLMVKEIW